VAMAPRLAIATRGAGKVYVAEPRDPVTKDEVCVAIRPEKIKLSRTGAASDDISALNRLEGVVTDIGYLGGMTTYKVRLDSGVVLRSSMANSARIDLDAYHVGDRVVAWFAPDDCVVLER
jgi:putrescine transport system ATP-binding protein